MNNNQIGACYIRVSTGKQEELSPDAQRRLILEYALKNQIHIPEEYIFTEAGISGKKADKRPEFQRMITLAKKKPKPFDIILLWKFSRFARNREDSIVYKSLLRKQCDIEVVSITEHIGDDKISILIEALLEAMDEYYSINLAEEVTRGMTEKALRGGYQSAPPLGYRQVNSGGIPVVVRDQATIIQYIFDQYVNYGREITTIARMCNDMGFTTQRGNKFEKRSIDYILRNPFYIGKIRWNGQKEIGDIILADGKHMPIVEVNTFQKAMERLKNELHPIKRRGASSCTHWLSGLLKCSVCGRSMIHIQNTSHKSSGFQCSGYAKGIHNGSQYISASIIEDAVLASMKEIIIGNPMGYHLEKSNCSSQSNEKAYLLSELEKLNTKEKRIKEAYQNGIDSLGEYKAGKERLLLNRNKIETQLVKSSQYNAVLEESQREIVYSVYDIISSPLIESTKKGELIRLFIEYMEVNKEKQVLKIVYYV